MNAAVARAASIPSPKGTIRGIDPRTAVTMAIFAAGMTALFLHDPISSMDFSVREPKEPKLDKAEEKHISIIESVLAIRPRSTSSPAAFTGNSGKRYSPRIVSEVDATQESEFARAVKQLDEEDGLDDDDDL